MMGNLQDDYCLKAFQSIRKWLFLLPGDVRDGILLAESLIQSHGEPTAEEMREQLGTNWVIGRRSDRIVQKYGEDVRCYSQAQYQKAKIDAIESRRGRITISGESLLISRDAETKGAGEPEPGRDQEAAE